jgi:hypothetical protein
MRRRGENGEGEALEADILPGRRTDGSDNEDSFVGGV